MTIHFACGCGRQLAAADEYAGKRVKCGNCGGIRTVPTAARPAVATPPPQPAAARPARATPPPVPTAVATRPLAPPRVQCECGQTYQARPEHAGKKIQCSKCARTVTVPPARPGPPPPRPTSLDDEERPRRRAPSEFEQEDEADAAPPTRRKKKSGARKWIYLGAGAAVAVTGIVLLLVWLLGDSISSDFDLVPRDAQGFVTIRVADLLATPVGKKVMDKVGDQKDKLKEIETKFGLSLQDVERVTVVLLDMDKKSAFVIVQTAKAADRSKVLKEMGNPSEQKHQGKSYHAAEGMAIHFADSKRVVCGDEASVKKALEGTKKSGPLEDALKVASKKKYQIAGAFSIPSSLLEQAKAGAAAVPGASDLLAVQTVSVALAVSDRIEIDARAYFPDSGKARSAADAAKQLLGLAKTFAPKEAAFLTRIPDPRQSGKAVEINWKIDKQEVESLIELGASQISVGAGRGRPPERPQRPDRPKRPERPRGPGMGEPIRRPPPLGR